MNFGQYFSIIKVFGLTTLSFIITILWTPALTHFLYKYQIKKRIREEKVAPIYSKMHQRKAGTPTMGGVLIWGTTCLLAVLFFVLSKVIDLEIFKKLNFLSRSQTLLPLGALFASAIIGLIDDFLNVRGLGHQGGGLRTRHRFIIYALIAIIGAWWFYFKLDWTTIHLPFIGNFDIGIWYIPIFIFIITASSHSVNLTDGLDGLAGGILLACFSAYAAVAFTQGKVDLASFLGVIIGALLAFLWFNIKPARFFMGDTGSMSLGVTLGIVAMLTNAALLLVVIALPLVIETLSVIIQVISRKFRKRKIFLSSPLHHHLEAKGWPEEKIVMRFWVIAGVCAVLGLMIYLIDKY